MRPRRHAHRGSVIAAGLVIEPAQIGEAAARARVLAWWTPGCEVHAVDGAWIVRLPAARRVAVLEAPGAPLVAQHGVLAALPLAAADVAALGAPAGAVIVARGGALRAIEAGHGEPLDPARWLAVEALEVIEVAALAAPPPALIAPAPPSADLRAALGLAAADPDALALRAALTGPPSDDGAAGDGDRAAPATPAPASWWARWTRWFRDRAASAAFAAGRAGARTGAAAGRPGRPVPPGRPGGTGTALARTAIGPWWARAVARALGRPRAEADAPAGAAPPPSWLERLRGRAALAIWRSALGRAVGRRHADHLRETLALFDRGELDRALRRAIPLDGGAAGPRHLALGLPAPRTALTPSLRPPGAGAVLPFATEAMALLRQRYHAARDRLLREDRVEEAAFVIADLLDDPAAAVAMLERRGRLRLAAELAEARALAPGLVIRQWFLAGDVPRAIAVAWRTGAFADAIARAGRDPIADRMRLTWASTRAAAGDYLGAIDLLAQLDDATAADPAAAERWIELGIAGGGVAAARLWIRRLLRAASRFAEVRAAVLPILAGGDDDALAQRLAIGQELIDAPRLPATATLARAAARALLADVGRGVDGEPATLLPRLVRLADDPALRADLPRLGKLAPRRALIDQDAPACHHWDRGDAGAIAVHDVALIPGGRVLVALGELGVRLLTADGRRIAAWDQPADALVVADHGTQAIALARRGRGQRLARIDLARRTARHWCDAELDAWATTFDGARWLVTRGRELLAVDATAAELRAGWGVGDPGTEAWRGLARDGEHWGAIHGEPGEAEAWIYEGFTLRHRLAVARAPAGATDVLVATAVLPAEGSWVRAVYQLADLGGAPAPVLVGPGTRLPLAALAFPARLTALVAAGRLAAVVARVADGVAVEVLHLPTQRTIARARLDGAGRVSARFAGPALCLGDDRGRAAIIDLRTGGRRCDLRVR